MIKNLFRQMILSQIVSAMAVTLCLLVDSIMIGRFLGVDAVAAYGLSNPVLLLFAAFGAFLSSGIQVVCSKAMGNGDEKKINVCYTISIIVAAIYSVVGVTLVIVFLDPLCEFLGAEPGTRVYELTKNYLKGFIFGAPAFIAAQILVPYLQMAGQRLRLVVAVLCMTIADVALDLLNVYVFKQDMFGMGLASTISYYIAVGIGLIYFFSRKCIYKFERTKFKLRCLGEIAAGGVPTIINQISLVLLVYTVNKVMMNTGGNLAVAAYSIVSTIANLGYCVGTGVSEVSLMLTSIYHTEEDGHSLRDIFKAQTFYGTIMGALATVVLLIFANPFVRLFLDTNPDAEGMAIWGLRVFAFCLVPSTLNAAFKKYYQAIGRIKFSESISIVQNFLFPAIVVLTFGNIFGDKAVWWFYLIGETLSLIYISIYVKLISKKKFLSLESFICLPFDFGIKPEDMMEFAIYNKGDVNAASSAASIFCAQKGLTRRKCMYTGLCIEEMGNNILQYGFKDGRKNRIDVRLVKKDDSMLIRIRDNCKGFNPVKYLDLNKYQLDDPGSHIGIRMTLKMVKNVQYVNSLGLNNLSLEI
ncbi:MAG: ATP-binding protein [Lachnospiraceae bacterium]|nr:ATP-binding protein [Lachnospiraceae bacterium]